MREFGWVSSSPKSSNMTLERWWRTRNRHWGSEELRAVGGKSPFLWRSNMKTNVIHSFFFLCRTSQSAALLERFTVPNQAGNSQDKYEKNSLSLTGNMCSLALTGEINHCRSWVAALSWFRIFLHQKSAMEVFGWVRLFFWTKLPHVFQ